jgi:hypothetical protein
MIVSQVRSSPVNSMWMPHALVRYQREWDNRGGEQQHQDGQRSRVAGDASQKRCAATCVCGTSSLGGASAMYVTP